MELHTERLLLREFVADDWARVLAYQSDQRYLRYYEWESRTAGAVQTFISVFLAEQQETPRTRYQLAVVQKESGILIGNCGIRKATADAVEAEIGYELAPDYWGRGYATEAALAILAFGFEALSVHRVSAWCIAENSASTQVLTRLGMRQEGRLREKVYFKGRWWDELIFGLLEREWHARTSGSVQ